MKPIIDELQKINVRKHFVTSIEYDCKTEKKEDEVFDAVRDILSNDLNSFSKITYDLSPADHKVKVEVIQNVR